MKYYLLKSVNAEKSFIRDIYKVTGIVIYKVTGIVIFDPNSLILRGKKTTKVNPQ
jgi:hypothetical protein